MAKKTTTSSERQGLKELRRKGLYKPENPRRVTEYGKSLLRKFSDVLSGNATVVTAKGRSETTGRAVSGFNLAKKYKVSDDDSGTVRVVRNKIIVPTQKGERARFNERTGKLQVVRKVGRAKYVREPFTGSPSALRDLERQLKPGDRISVPIWRGKRGVEWSIMTQEEFKRFWNEYGPRGSAIVTTAGGRVRKHRYRNLAQHVQRFRYDAPKREPLEDFEDDGESEY